MTLPPLPPRKLDAHKGEVGRVLLLGGSPGMVGAISLSGMAALRSGAGLVTLAVPSSCWPTVASFDPCYMTLPLDEDASGQIARTAEACLEEPLDRATAMGIGPGMGRSSDLTQLVSRLFYACPLPMVIDADALFALSERPTGLARAGGPRILTPHAGEFARLIGTPLGDRSAACAAARQLAAASGTVLVLKGRGTFVTDGTREFTNDTGNPGMATGGSGDVLTGIITALWAQGLSPFDAACLGVHLHGRAGDIAAGWRGQMSLIATDLLAALADACQQYANDRR